jgi:hypothetical protein
MSQAELEDMVLIDELWMGFGGPIHDNQHSV